MAQKSSIELEVKFDDIDQTEINKIASQASKAFSNIRIDPNLTNVQKELNSLQKDQLKTVSGYEKLQLKALNLVKKRGDSLQRVEDIQVRLDSLSAKANIAEEKIAKKIVNNHDEINRKKQEASTLEQSIAQQRKSLSDLTSEMIGDEEESAKVSKAKLKIERDGIRLSRLQGDIKNKEINSQNLITGAEQEKNKFQAESLSLQRKINGNIENARDIESEIKDVRAEQTTNQKTQQEINDNIITKKRDAFEIENQHLMGANMLMQDRLALQEQIAQQVMATNPALSHAEALDLARKEYPLSVKQSKLDGKAEKVFLKTNKIKKQEWKFRKRDLKLLKNKLKQEKVGMFERRRALKEEEAALLKQLGLRKGMLGVGPKRVGKPGMADTAKKEAGKQVSGLTAVIGKLAGPLMALGSIAGFIMLMLEYDKRIKDAQKSLFVLASNSDMAWKKIGKGQTMGIGQMESYRSTLRGLWGTVGMTYEDALKHVGDLTNAGIKLDVVLKNNAKVMQEVESMSLLSGKSFGEMAGITGEWVTEFRKGTGQLMGTFVSLRDSAAKTDFTTNRFFSSVMNAAQGLAIYGTRVEDVGAAFADLVTGVKMPQKEAAKLASSMLDATNSMTSAQKVMTAQQGGAEGMLKTEKDRLAKLVATGKATKDQKDELKKITKLMENEYPDELEKQTRFFDALDPGQQIELRMKALSKAAPDLFKNVNISDPKQLAQVLSLNREKLAEVGTEFGFDKKQLMLVEELSNAGKKITGIGRDIVDSQGKAEAKKLAKQAKKQARVIEQGTKSFKDMVAQKIGRWVEGIYFFMMNTLAPFLDMVADYFGRDAKFKKRNEAKMAESIKSKKTELEAIKKKEAGGGKLTAEEKRKKSTLPIDIQSLETAQKRSKAGKSSNMFQKIAAAVIPGVQSLEKTSSQITGSAMGASTVRELKGKFDRAKFETQESRNLANLAISKLNTQKNLIAIGEGRSDKLRGTLNWLTAKINDTANTNPNVSKSDAAKILSMINSDVGSFSKGGYTGDIPKLSKVVSGLKSYRGGGLTDAAGIVHSKEFVFDKQATKNIGSANLQSLMQSAKSGSMAGQGAVNNNQQIVININQKDRQEIEQIVRKVLWERAS